MIEFNTMELMELSAKTVKNNFRCIEHRQTPNYTIENGNLEWTFCCENHARLVKERYKAELKKNMNKELEKLAIY